jgi:hypothetical protein
MSKNEDMEVGTDRGHGLQGTNKNSEVHAARVNKGSSRGANENEREHLHQEQPKKLDYHSKHSNEAHGQWTEVGGRASGGRSKANDNQNDNHDSNEVQNQWNKVGSRANGGYKSNNNQNDNRDSNGDSNGGRACRNDNHDEHKNKKDTDDGMPAYTCKMIFIEVRFMCSSGRGFNIARDFKEFVNAVHKQDAEFTILPLQGNGNNICNTIDAMDVPGSQECIERYYRHEIKAHTVNGKIRIRASMALGALKKRNSPFHNYLDNNCVYINNAQLG